jgi:hypothetical protein
VDDDGVEIKDTPYTIEAFVEQEDKGNMRSDGITINPLIKIQLSPEAVIKKGDYIEVTELHGTVPNEDDASMKKVTRAEHVGSFTVSHIEVEADSGAD